MRTAAAKIPGSLESLRTSLVDSRRSNDEYAGLARMPPSKKKPSTSELLDWLKLLVAEQIPPDALRSKDDKIAVPPLAGALLKNEQDMHLFERLVFMARSNR